MSAIAPTALIAEDEPLLAQALHAELRALWPGMSGLDAAVALADAWDTSPGAAPFPALVFVTAYDQYAVAAFEAQALDYVLKPVQTKRLQKPAWAQPSTWCP